MGNYFKYRFCLFVAFVMAICCAHAQRVSVSSNIIGYANMLTINGEGSVALSRHWSAAAGFKYNPFTFRTGNDGADQFQNKQQSYSLGMRFWPWHVYSGWWVAGKVQYQEYNTGGLISPETREGDRIGIGASGGYTHMILKNLNLEFGLGFWGGADKYTIYNCPVCGLTESSGTKAFILPNEIIVALSYVF